MRNYYDILEVSQAASREVIKAAYQAKSESLKQTEKFQSEEETQYKQLQTAYQVLSDPEKRQEYNQLGHQAYVEKNNVETTSDQLESQEGARRENSSETTSQHLVQTNGQTDNTPGRTDSRQSTSEKARELVVKSPSKVVAFALPTHLKGVTGRIPGLRRINVHALIFLVVLLIVFVLMLV